MPPLSPLFAGYTPAPTPRLLPVCPIPDIANGFVWPCYNDKPLGFIAQLDLSTLPFVPPSCWDCPNRACAVLFLRCRADTPCRGEPKDSGRWCCVHYQPDTRHLRAATKPESLSAENSFPHRRLQPAACDSPLTPQDFIIHHENELDEDDQDTLYQMFTSLQGPWNWQVHQLGGYPVVAECADDPLVNCRMSYDIKDFIQHLRQRQTNTASGQNPTDCPSLPDIQSPHPAELRALRDWVLLFQIEQDATAHMSWPELSPLLFYIHPDDLARLDFSRVRIAISEHHHERYVTLAENSEGTTDSEIDDSTDDNGRDTYRQDSPANGHSLQSLIQPCIRWEHAGRSKSRGKYSRLGGLPDVPAGFHWPQHNGYPLAFLAQLDLGELPGSPPSLHGLPQQGILYFFYDSVAQPWGYNPADQGSWQVIYCRDTATLTPARQPEDLDEDEALFLPVTLHPVMAHSLPSAEYYAENTASPDSGILETLESLSEDPIFYPGFSHRMGGYPQPVQNDEMPLECQLASHGLYCGDSSGYEDPRARKLAQSAVDWTLLLQLDSDDNTAMMWGDCGRLYFWIRRQDLAKQDFSHVWCVLQCF